LCFPLTRDAAATTPAIFAFMRSSQRATSLRGTARGGGMGSRPVGIVLTGRRSGIAWGPVW
jgi:hypothetical protein